jgi:hypothetical protein
MSGGPARGHCALSGGMRRFVRWSVRVLLGLVAVAVVLAGAAIFMRDTIMKEVFTRRLRGATGMKVEVASVHVGMDAPTLTILGLRLYNTADFGGGLCLDMPELRVEYDRAALGRRIFHLTLARLDLSGLTVVKDKKGRINFETLKKAEKATAARESWGSGFKFDGVDTLELSLGKFHLSDLASGHEQVIDFGITNQVFHHVKTEADLSALSLLLALRGASSSGDAGFDMGSLLKTLTSH